MSEASISLTTYIKDLIDWITGTISSSTSNQSMHASHITDVGLMHAGFGNGRRRVAWALARIFCQADAFDAMKHEWVERLRSRG